MPTEKKTWIWKLDPKILNEVDKYVLVKKEDLIKDFDFLYSKIYLYLCKMRANETTDNIQSIIEMVYFYFESRKKKYLEEDKP